MKLKIATLACMAFAGVGASVALAHDGHGKGEDHGAACKKVHVNGTVAAGSLTVTPRAHKDTTTTPGAVTIAVPAGASVEATACATVSGTSTTWTLKEAEIHVRPAKATTTATTQAATTQTTTTTH
jgi:hypothetical protein